MIPTHSAPSLSLPPRRADRAGLYIHFPYCVQKCDYCDFYSLSLEGEKKVGAEFFERFRRGLVREFQGRVAAFRTRPIDTVYFGGGTGSMLPAEFIAGLLAFFRDEGLFPANSQESVEITLEGNPEHFTPDYLRDLHRAGVTRVNTGIQTFERRALEAMNRYFDAERYDRILADLGASPIEHLGADLIYGLPGQSEASFYRDLDALLATRLDHLSLYSLTAEAGTRYAAKLQTGRATPPDEEAQTAIFCALPAYLAERGFAQYEISNFARPGATCRHNLRYWYYEPYLALGPGAHGFDGLRRYGNARNLEKWLADPLHAAPVPHEPTADVALNLLRLTAPIPRDFIDEIWSEMPELSTQESRAYAGAFHRQLAAWVEQGLAEWTRATATTGEEQAAFRWREAGLLQLDDRIFEMHAALEKIDGRS